MIVASQPNLADIPADMEQFVAPILGFGDAVMSDFRDFELTALLDHATEALPDAHGDVSEAVVPLGVTVVTAGISMAVFRADSSLGLLDAMSAVVENPDGIGSQVCDLVLREPADDFRIDFSLSRDRDWLWPYAQDEDPNDNMLDIARRALAADLMTVDSTDPDELKLSSKDVLTIGTQLIAQST